MIVKNEERCLKRCLDSVQNLVSEIIVVDTGSTDRTIEIAREYTNKIYHFQWTNNFAEARNYALQYATGDYILHLDADEYIGSHPESLKVLLDKDYYFVRIRNDLGSGFAEMHQFVRLFRNDSKLRYVGALHEQVDLEKVKDLQPDLIDAIIYHDGYLEHVVRDKVKLDRNMKIIMDEVEKHPNAFNFFNLGVQYSLENKHEKALEVFKKAYSMGRNFSYAPRILMFIMKSLSELNRYNEALSVGKDSALIYSEHADFQYRVGLIYEQLGYDMDAISCFQKCLEIGEDKNRTQFNHYEGTASYLAHAQLAELYMKNSRKDKAQDHFIMGVKTAPDLLAFIKIFTDLYPHVRGKEFVDAVVNIWPINEVKRLEQLVVALYTLRHPGTLDLIDCYDVHSLTLEVEAWLSTVKGDDIKSEDLWMKAVDIKDHHFRDILLVDFIRKDPSILRLHRSTFNIRETEWKWWEDLVSKRLVTDITITRSIQEQWSMLCEDIIRLNRFELLEDLINSSNVPILRYMIATNLYKFGFEDIALEVVVESNETVENNLIYGLVRKILVNLGNLDDAAYYAEKAYSLQKNFMNGYELVKIKIMQNKINEANAFLEDLSDLEPESPWAINTGIEKWVDRALIQTQN